MDQATKSNPDQTDQYQDRYVAFLDILGFSHMAREADKNPELREVLRNAIEILRTTVGEDDFGEVRTQQFSDCIVISSAINSAGLFRIFRGCEYLTINLIQFGILLRGGITRGNLWHDKNLLFGVGLVSAYDLELRGGPPRIIIDQPVIDDVSRPDGANSLDFFLRSDHGDGTVHLHILRGVEDALMSRDRPPRAGRVPLESFLFPIRRAIETESQRLLWPDAVRAKWRWMRQYWNDTVAGSEFVIPWARQWDTGVLPHGSDE